MYILSGILFYSSLEMIASFLPCENHHLFLVSTAYFLVISITAVVKHLP